MWAGRGYVFISLAVGIRQGPVGSLSCLLSFFSLLFTSLTSLGKVSFRLASKLENFQAALSLAVETNGFLFLLFLSLLESSVCDSPD